MRHGRALAACAGLLAGTAAAQDCKGPNCPGQKIYPKFEHFYIKKVCGPTIVPGSCHGHFQTQWRKWDESCPNGNCDPAAQLPIVVTHPVEAPAEAPKATEAPKPAVPPKVETKPDLVVPPKDDTAPKPAPVPEKPKLQASAAPLPLPAVTIPPVEISIPAVPPLPAGMKIAK